MTHTAPRPHPFQSPDAEAVDALIEAHLRAVSARATYLRALARLAALLRDLDDLPHEPPTH
jgi:hypothetical protein